MQHSIKFPKFKRYGILTKEIMDIVSNTLFDFLNTNFCMSSNGIITGFDVKYIENKNKFKISKGVIKYNNQIYWLSEDKFIEKPKEEGRYYLVFNILNKEDELFYINIYNFEFKKENNILKEDFKLFSIILRDGANIESANHEFDKYRNEFNTIDTISTNYCCPYSLYPSISPKLLKKWSSLMCTKSNIETVDLNFAFLCMNSIISRECLVGYINLKLNVNRTVSDTNITLVQDLSMILKTFDEKKLQTKSVVDKIEKIHVD
ncbi:hypothetical protein [Caviibacter abscessus]|uniref:hypothetical protein n=1 Tax=Caviibacter abscessus TaxID=1766719 RepID=UPI0008374EDD|nr:hypothetical protein [Caviibacter abscessus]